MICTPQNLSNAASAWRKLSARDKRKVQAYILCRIANIGGMGKPNLIPAGSQYTGATPTYTLTVQTNTTYQIIWGANDLSMKMGGGTYPSTGAGTTTTVWTKGNTQMVFTGTFAGTSVTAMVKVAPAQAIPIPGDFAFALNASGTAVTASWDAPPSVVTQTKVWTSTDGVTYTLAGAVGAPGTSLSVTPPLAGSTLYCKAQYCIGIGCGQFSSVLTYSDNLAVSLVAYWSMEEGSNATRVDATGNGNNLVGSFGGSGMNQVPGRIGFGAGTAAQGNASCLNTSGPNTSWFSVQAGDSFCISSWINFKAIPTNTFNGVISMWKGSGNWSYLLVFATTSTLSLFMENAANSGSATLTVVNPPSTGVWYHIVFGYDDATQKMWFQLNNGARQTAALVGVYNPAATQFFQIGRYNADNGCVFASFDETGWWRRTLSVGEVARLYNGGAGLAYPL